MLRVEQLRKSFRLGRGRTIQAVDGVSLTLASGEVLGLVGESGSGKSTLGRTIAGLLPRDGGQVFFEGQPLPRQYRTTDFRRLARAIQMVFQDPFGSLNPRATVLKILAEGLEAGGLRGREVLRREAAGWLERVGLAPEHLSRYPHEFSGGQRQRIGIARALAPRPRLLICDEPISALDVSVQAQIVTLLGTLRQSMGLTLLFIAHDLAMVRHVADRMAVMYRGGIVEIGPADAVFRTPLHPYTRLLIAANPLPDPVRERTRLPLPPVGDLADAGAPVPGCRFAGRCPEAAPACRQTPPPLREVTDGRWVGCWHHVTEPRR
ncbi:MAG: ABC transporter ATP-binding protein [Magnetococcales bacterium]|nr:ABC transporter ATP-binding protein [Magnetococcales bacterium]